jgi:hypothetical protein
VTWLRIDDTALDHPKIAVLSDAAHRALFNSWIYCAKHETDGRFPAAMADAFTRQRAKARDELVTGKLWHENGSGYVVHDFNERNPTHESLERDRARAAERKRRSRNGGTAS